MSRGLSGDQFPFTLVPVLDFVNHNTGKHNAIHSYDNKTETFKLIASKDIKAQEEVYLYFIIVMIIKAVLLDIYYLWREKR